jgi:hypothetical protein
LQAVSVPSGNDMGFNGAASAGPPGKTQSSIYVERRQAGHASGICLHNVQRAVFLSEIRAQAARARRKGGWRYEERHPP